MTSFYKNPVIPACFWRDSPDFKNQLPETDSGTLLPGCVNTLK
jgi:hypothetical protein